jgi:hypothetical protein
MDHRVKPGGDEDRDSDSTRVEHALGKLVRKVIGMMEIRLAGWIFTVSHQLVNVAVAFGKFFSTSSRVIRV